MRTHVKKFAIQKLLLILLLLADIVNLVLITLSTTCFIKARLGETLSSRTRTLFFSSLPVMWCKSVRWVHKWDTDKSKLTGIEAQYLFPTVIYWLNCRHAQTIDYVIVQTPDSFPQNLHPGPAQTVKIFERWTYKVSLLSNGFNHFPANGKSLFLQSCPEEFVRFICECIIILLKGSLQNFKGLFDYCL